MFRKSLPSWCWCAPVCASVVSSDGATSLFLSAVFVCRSLTETIPTCTAAQTAETQECKWVKLTLLFPSWVCFLHTFTTASLCSIRATCPMVHLVVVTDAVVVDSVSLRDNRTGTPGHVLVQMVCNRIVSVCSPLCHSCNVTDLTVPASWVCFLFWVWWRFHGNSVFRLLLWFWGHFYKNNHADALCTVSFQVM